MKKLYRKGTIHPTPSVVSDHLLSFLPAAILALTVALSPADKEVLAYLVSCSSSTRRKSSDGHQPSFGCNCFGCYTSYWVRWDTSPNRQLIHEIIDAYEDTLLKKGKNQNPLTCHSSSSSSVSKRDKRKGKKVKANGFGGGGAGHELNKDLSGESAAVLCDATDGSACGGASEEAAVAEEKGGSVGRFVSFLGQSLWGGGVWG